MRPIHLELHQGLSIDYKGLVKLEDLSKNYPPNLVLLCYYTLSTFSRDRFHQTLFALQKFLAQFQQHVFDNSCYSRIRLSQKWESQSHFNLENQSNGNLRNINGYLLRTPAQIGYRSDEITFCIFNFYRIWILSWNLVIFEPDFSVQTESESKRTEWDFTKLLKQICNIFVILDAFTKKLIIHWKSVIFVFYSR